MADTFQIVIKKGPKSGSVVELTQEVITIGRETSNLLYINDHGLSRSHASLNRSGADYILKDLGSTNGTFVNGKAVSDSYTLKDGDLISLGEVVDLEFRKVSTSADSNATFVIPRRKNEDGTEILPTRADLEALKSKPESETHAEEHRASSVAGLKSCGTRKITASRKNWLRPNSSRMVQVGRISSRVRMAWLAWSKSGTRPSRMVT